MKDNFQELLDEIEVYNDLLVDVGGKTFKAKDYIKYYHLGMKAQFDKKLIPSSYEYPTGAQLELTYKCNQRCIHCYNQSGEDNNSNIEGMQLEEWKKIATELGEAGIFQCVLSGGEPTLLGDGLFEIMDILHEYKVKFIVITNGMLIDEDRIKKFKKYQYSWFQVSIDGSRPELHNFVRGVDAWEKAINAANLVKQAGLPLVIAHAVVKQNINYLEEMIDLAYLLGASKIIAGPFSYMGRAVLNSENLELTSDEKKLVYEIVNKKAKEYAGRMDVAVSSEEVIALRVKLIEPNGVMLIRPNGDVKVDCGSPFIIGNCKEKSLMDIWNETGREVWKHPRLMEYVLSIKKESDLLTVKPRINVDPDEMLYPVEKETK